MQRIIFFLLLVADTGAYSETNSVIYRHIISASAFVYGTCSTISTPILAAKQSVNPGKELAVVSVNNCTNQSLNDAHIIYSVTDPESNISYHCQANFIGTDKTCAIGRYVNSITGNCFDDG